MRSSRDNVPNSFLSVITGSWSMPLLPILSNAVHNSAPALHYLLLNCRCCAALDEPADEGYPQTVKKVSPQSEPYTESYEKETDETSGVGRNQSCSPEIARNTPHNRAKNPSAVQRESGN